MNRLKVWAIYAGFAVLFAAVFAVMLVLLVTAVIGVPAGIMLGVFGLAIRLFRVDFIITELSPLMMIFGGAAGAFACAFCGLLGVKAGFMISRLFLSAQRVCDRLRGW